MRPLLLIMALAASSLTGCSSKKSINRDQMQSEIRQASSFAAESEMLIDFVLQGHAAVGFANAHAAYLEDAVEESAKELEDGMPQSDTEDASANAGALSLRLRVNSWQFAARSPLKTRML